MLHLGGGGGGFHAGNMTIHESNYDKVWAQFGGRLFVHVIRKRAWHGHGASLLKVEFLCLQSVEVFLDASSHSKQKTSIVR